MLLAPSTSYKCGSLGILISGLSVFHVALYFILRIHRSCVTSGFSAATAVSVSVKSGYCLLPKILVRLYILESALYNKWQSHNMGRAITSR